MVKEYFYGQFPEHLKRLKCKLPNAVVRRVIMHDSSAVFFGGRDWKNVRTDLEGIPERDLPSFILCLLLVVLTDQCLYSHFYEHYSIWRSKTSYPKFGWSGFGVHNENPLHILWAPERANLVRVDDLIFLLPEFTDFLINETCKFIRANLPRVDQGKYFKVMLQDAAFDFSLGRLIPNFKSELTNALTKAVDYGANATLR